jgi:threonine synthase
MTEKQTNFQCIECGWTAALEETIYRCGRCQSLLEVAHRDPAGSRNAIQWRQLFDERMGVGVGHHASGVWRFHEWVLPDLPCEDIVTLGEGNTPLVEAKRLGDSWGIELFIKQCGQSLSGSFKDLGMTVLVSQVQHMRRKGISIPAVACASTGDTSAALAAYGAAAGLRTLVLLPKGKITQAQLVQPLSHGAKVIAIDTDFDGCMAHVARLCEDEGVYLANSKNSLRIEGQKTVAFEISQALGWQAPDWVAIPGGNLGNVSALAKGFELLAKVGVLDARPRLLCGQAQNANPLYRSYKDGFSPLLPIQAQPTHASAIRIGDPVSFPKAVRALKAFKGVVQSVDEKTIEQVASEADQSGLYVCPHTAVALASVHAELQEGTIKPGQRVVVVATAHALKFTEFKMATALNEGLSVKDSYSAVKKAALEDL